MDITRIQSLVRSRQYVYSLHADLELKAENLTFAQVRSALINGTILEQYPDTGRGESCLIVGLADDLPLHIVCGWWGEKMVIITAYIPRLPKFVDPWTRVERKKNDEQ